MLPLQFQFNVLCYIRIMAHRSCPVEFQPSPVSRISQVLRDIILTYLEENNGASLDEILACVTEQTHGTIIQKTLARKLQLMENENRVRRTGTDYFQIRQRTTSTPLPGLSSSLPSLPFRETLSYLETSFLPTSRKIKRLFSPLPFKIRNYIVR